MADETTAPDPTEAAAAAVAQASAQAASTTEGPWATQLAETFTDPDQQAAVNEFLRATVQPYVTRLEQSTADLKDAQRLYEDLTANPGETYIAITEELFGDEAAARVTEALKSGEAVVTETGEVELPPAAAAADPETKELLDYVRDQRQAAEYETVLNEFVVDHPDVKPNLFHPFVSAADGDFELAYSGYAQWQKDWAAENGEPATEEVVEPEVAPPVVGKDGSTTEPPLEPKNQTMDEAINEFLAENRAAPPVVGAV